MDTGRPCRPWSVVALTRACVSVACVTSRGCCRSIPCTPWALGRQLIPEALAPPIEAVAFPWDHRQCEFRRGGVALHALFSAWLIFMLSQGTTLSIRLLRQVIVAHRALLRRCISKPFESATLDFCMRRCSRTPYIFVYVCAVGGGMLARKFIGFVPAGVAVLLGALRCFDSDCMSFIR